MKFRFVIALIILAAVFALSAGSSAAKSPRFCRVDKPSDALSAREIDSNRTSSNQLRGIQLLVSNFHVAPGEPVYARLANFGKKRAFYSREFAIQRRSGGGWERDPASPKGPWVKVAGVLKPGSAGRCYRFDVPTDQPAGQYRFSTKITGPKISNGAQHRTAIFRVG
jgi:hypothetical protein